MTIPYDTFPAPHLVDGLRRYIEQGIPPGGFMRAVLEDRLFMAALMSNATKAEYDLPAICQWIVSNAPIYCWANEDRVNDWIARGGLIGREDQA